MHIHFFEIACNWIIFSAYMLAAGAFGPMYGKLSNMFGTRLGAIGFGFSNQTAGRKPILYSSIFTFLVRIIVPLPPSRLIINQLGSALAGAAQSMDWLIIARAVQGIGGGGIMQLVFITIADIVPLKE